MAAFESATPPAPAPDAGPGTPPEGVRGVKLPKSDKPCIFIDQGSGMFWLGVPLMRTPFIETSVILDEAKTHAYSWYKSQSVKNKLMAPVNDAFQRTKQFLRLNGK